MLNVGAWGLGAGGGGGMKSCSSNSASRHYYYSSLPLSCLSLFLLVSTLFTLYESVSHGFARKHQWHLKVGIGKWQTINLSLALVGFTFLLCPLEWRFSRGGRARRTIVAPFPARLFYFLFSSHALLPTTINTPAVLCPPFFWL